MQLGFFCLCIFVVLVYWKGKNVVMYDRLGSPGIRVHASLVIMYIKGRTFKINSYFVLVVGCSPLNETTPTCPTI